MLGKAALVTAICVSRNNSRCEDNYCSTLPGLSANLGHQSPYSVISSITIKSILIFNQIIVDYQEELKIKVTWHS